jgi:hypothetical protein
MELVGLLSRQRPEIDGQRRLKRELILPTDISAADFWLFSDLAGSMKSTRSSPGIHSGDEGGGVGSGANLACWCLQNTVSPTNVSQSLKIVIFLPQLTDAKLLEGGG